LGEVQEMIDICDFAVGLSRQLHGLTIASERPDHRMLETWHPYGVCGVISAFNFPVAVWAWNAALALACGNAVVWKPSEKTPLTAWAAHALLRRTLEAFDASSPTSSAGHRRPRSRRELVAHPDVRLVSATGSTAMGRAVGEACARRFKRTILELGGNNAAIVAPSATRTSRCARSCSPRWARRPALHDAAAAVRARVAVRRVRRRLKRRTRASASATRASADAGRPLIDGGLRRMQRTLAQARAKAAP
jgi:acyl-CoA reductase-like NAD-dependent aldehyde dehydrogenase